MNWEDIQKHIQENRTDLDQDQVRDDLWMDLKKKIDERKQTEKNLYAQQKEIKKENRFFISRQQLMVAASLIFAVIATWTIATNVAQQQQAAAGVDLHSFSPTLREAELHFSVQTARLENQIRETLPEDQAARSTGFLADLEQQYEKLEEQALETGISEEIIQAMINNYRTRVRLLERILDEARRAQPYQEKIKQIEG